MAALQAIDATTLRALLAELRPLLLPSRFEKAQQADPHTLQLALRSLAGIHWLELGWQAEAPRLHAVPPPPRQPGQSNQILTPTIDSMYILASSVVGAGR